MLPLIHEASHNFNSTYAHVFNWVKVAFHDACFFGVISAFYICRYQSSLTCSMFPWRWDTYTSRPHSTPLSSAVVQYVDVHRRALLIIHCKNVRPHYLSAGICWWISSLLTIRNMTLVIAFSNLWFCGGVWRLQCLVHLWVGRLRYVFNLCSVTSCKAQFLSLFCLVSSIEGENITLHPTLIPCLNVWLKIWWIWIGNLLSILFNDGLYAIFMY